MTDVNYGIRISADGGGQVAREFSKVADSTRQIGAEAARLNDQQRNIAQSLNSIGREALNGDFGAMPRHFADIAENANLSAGAIARIVVPLGLLTAATVAAAAAYAEGAREANEMNKALAITNNYTGQTRGHMIALAHEISAAGDMTIKTSKTIVTELTRSGQIGAEALGAIARIAEDYAAATGRDVEKLGPELVRLFADPAKGAEMLDKQMHLLSVTEKERIQTLTRTGQVTEAQLALAEKVAEHMQRQPEHVGVLEGAWRRLQKAASGAWDAMLGLGREQTLDEKLLDANAQVSALQGRRFVDPRRLAAATRNRDDLQAQSAGEIANAAQKSAAAKKNEEQQAAYAIIQQASSYQQILEIKEKIAKVSAFEADTVQQRLNQTSALKELEKQLHDAQHPRNAAAEEQARKNAALLKQGTADWIKAIDDSTKEYEDQLRAQAKLADEARAYEQKMREVDAASWVKKIDNDIKEYEDGLRVMADYHQRHYENLAREQKKADDKLASETKRQADRVEAINKEIGRSLTDSIFRGFENAKPFLENFKDSVVNTFKTLVIRFAIEPYMTRAVGAVGGALGFGGSGAALAGGGGGGLGFLNNASSLGNLFGGGQTLADFGNFFGNIGALTETGEVFGLMDAIGGFAISNPLTAGLGILGALALGSSLFGGGAGYAQNTGADISGTISRAGITGSHFSNSSNGQDNYRWYNGSVTDVLFGQAMTADTNAQIAALYKQLGTYGGLLGADTSKLNSLTATYSVGGIGEGGSLNASQAAMAALAQASDQLVQQLIPNIKSFAQANETLTQTFVRLGQAAAGAKTNEILTRMSSALSLQDQTTALFTGDLSPLSNKQKLDMLGAQYASTLAAAQGGDLKSMGALSGVAQNYLTQARGFYATGDAYKSIFSSVQGDVQDLVADTLTEQAIRFTDMGVSLGEIAANTQNLDERIARALAAALSAQGAASDAAVQAQTRALVQAILDAARAAANGSFVPA